jgi:hypothetical protein
MTGAASVAFDGAERKRGTAVPENKAPRGGAQMQRTRYSHCAKKYSSSFVLYQVFVSA